VSADTADGILDWMNRDNFEPRSVNASLARSLFIGVDQSVKDKAKELLLLNWKIYVVNQSRGRCYYKQKTITIPSWVLLTKSTDYKIWYICHEMAHALATVKDNHGPAFMATLISICPKRCVEFELEYKPRNARSAGIGAITMDDL